jgi:DNA-binding NarL/FixJ family response regulator
MATVAIWLAQPTLRDEIAKRLRAAAPGTTTLCAGSAQELTALLAQRKIDLVLADWSMIGRVDGLIGAEGPALLALAGEDQAIDALRQGLRAVLPRNSDPAGIVAAARAALHGLAVVAPAVLDSLLGDLPPEDDKPAGGPRVGAEPEVPSLTPRELEVLAALADGASNKLIARRLGISFHTAKFHVAAVLEKLDADSRTEAVAKGARLGLVML